MSKEITMFPNIEISKRKFYHRKNVILLKGIGIKKIQVSSMFSSSKKIKYFIGYKDDDDDYKIKPLFIMLPKMALL